MSVIDRCVWFHLTLTSHLYIFRPKMHGHVNTRLFCSPIFVRDFEAEVFQQFQLPELSAGAAGTSLKKNRKTCRG
jgi:hypothetical protein